MEWLDLIKSSSLLFLCCIGIFGLIIGSFLNVVIWRLPQMLHRQWSIQSHEYLQENPYSKIEEQAPFNLITPRSHCPHCQHPIGALENIPILSFIVLRGRCRSCHQTISWRYPLIEAFTALLSIVTAFHFGFTWLTLAALILTWSLVALSVIDLDHQILPDDIIFPVLWLGLFVNIHSAFIALSDAVIGVIAGYLFLWSIFWLFKLFTGKEGMGYGDFKLLAMLGAWFGWQALPSIILISSFSGALVGITLILMKRRTRSQPIPFGPFIALAGWIAMIWGDKLTHLYLTYTGLT